MSASKNTKLIWLPSGGQIGNGIMIASLFAELLEKNPHLRIVWAEQRNAEALADIAKAYPAITVVSIPDNQGEACAIIDAHLKNKSKKPVVVVPPIIAVTGNASQPVHITNLAKIYEIRGDKVIEFRHPTRDPTWRHLSCTLVHYDDDVRYIDNLRGAMELAGLQTNPIGSPPRMEFDTLIPYNFPFREKPYFVIHAFGQGTTLKSMPIRRWRDVIWNLQQSYRSYSIVVTGAKDDGPYIKEMVAGYKNVFPAIDLPLREIAGIIDGAQLYIGIDTGPTHIAGVLGKPSVVIASQHDPVWLPDYNPNAVMVWDKEHCVCADPEKTCVAHDPAGHDHRLCVYGVSDDQIMDAVRDKLPAIQ
jgi:ADP-heptose:LPS heptosyltransferase